MTFRSASTSAKHRPDPARADGQHHRHKVIAPLLNKYGKMIITIGFALGDLKMPMFRKPIPIFDGGLYAGQWDSDARHGRGTMRYANGDAYEGDWSLGRRHGGGRLQAADGRGSAERRRARLYEVPLPDPTRRVS